MGFAHVMIAGETLLSICSMEYIFFTCAEKEVTNLHLYNMIDWYIYSALLLLKCNPFFNYKYICDD